MNLNFSNNNLKSNFQIGYGLNQNQNYNLYQNQSQNQFQNNFQTKKILGYSFENLIYNEISQTNYQVFTKKEIANRYGLNDNLINNMILGPNFIVTIQSKWNDTKPSKIEITNFIRTTQQISQFENKFYLGIYLSKLSSGSESELMFEQENLYSTNKFISIYSQSQSQLTYQLQSILYTYGIFYYEPDGTTIMLE